MRDSVMNDSDCVRFLQWALPRIRMRWPGYRKVRSQVCKRISRRMKDLGLPDLVSYRAFLELHPAEWPALDACCRVTISRFFRDKAVFAFLGQEVLPALAVMVRNRSGSELRCWSIGSASGEEPYSLALLWDHSVGLDFPDITFTILGTDADPPLVQRAEEGRYRPSSLKELPGEWRSEAFIKMGEVYSLGDGPKRHVSFSVQDIRTEMPDGSFHLVLCRNLVFTYFDEALQREILDRIVERIIPGGALVIGSHESLPRVIEGLPSWSEPHRTFRKPRSSHKGVHASGTIAGNAKGSDLG
jgi:chemotaxis protein methyltransferase CheR